MTRKALVDIGASGPIAGFIISVIVSMIGLSLSKVVAIGETKGALGLGDSLLFSFLSDMILNYQPGFQDIALHPVAFAGWIGLFVTSLNLIPIGQLDGGHIAYALLGEKHFLLSNILVATMVFLGLLLWEGWTIWAILLIILGRRHPPVLHWEVPLDTKRRFIGWVSLAIFVFTFIPVPFKIL
jgi:membrane-associated protease RseP (regulator of RpoE activity)